MNRTVSSRLNLIKGILAFSAVFLPVPLPAAGEAEASIPPGPTVILVDKEKNQLHVAEYRPDSYRIMETYRATVGRVRGDKVDEGDLKTPEGIYRFTANLTPPTLKKKFGVRAFYMDFPNPFDRLAGRTGSDIMLHATNEPERLKKDFDSEGCIVVLNEQIEEIRPHVRLGLTPILVFDELEETYLHPEGDGRLTGFIRNWVGAWTGHQMDVYMEAYHSGFRSRGMNREEWKAYKSRLSRTYGKIEISADNIRYFRHPKYNVVTFHQNYRSFFKNGAPAFSASGTKVMYIAEEEGDLKIISEEMTSRRW